MTREGVSRIVATSALAVVVVAIALILFGGGSGHVVYADFTDAGQLVGGDLVTVAGHQVGSIGGIALAPNGTARVELDISDDSVWPLHEGTRAEIRQLSLTGVANRYVGLTLSGGDRTIPENGTIATEYTKGIVDLDILLDALTPRVRSSLQRLIKTGAYTFSGSTPSALNSFSHVLSPALAQTAAFGREVVADRFALDRLVASAAQVSSSLAARDGDLSGAVSETAAWLREAAGERAALTDTLSRAPAVLGQARGVLADVSSSLGALNPALRDLRPVAPRLADLLRVVNPAARGLVPTISGINGLIGRSERVLGGFPAISRRAVPSVRSLTRALTDLTPILSGIRPYVPDQVAGFFDAIGGDTGQSYDANGHFARVSPILAGNGESLTGLLNVLGGAQNLLTPFKGLTTGHARACPGGGAPPAADASNPFTNADIFGSVRPLCNPADDQR